MTSAQGLASPSGWAPPGLSIPSSPHPRSSVLHPGCVPNSHLEGCGAGLTPRPTPRGGGSSRAVSTVPQDSCGEQATTPGTPGGLVIFSNKGSVLCVLDWPDDLHTTTQPCWAPTHVDAHKLRGATPEGVWRPVIEGYLLWVSDQPQAPGSYRAPSSGPCFTSPVCLASYLNKSRPGRSKAQPPYCLWSGTSAHSPASQRWLRGLGTSSPQWPSQCDVWWREAQEEPWGHVGCDRPGAGVPRLRSL